MDRLSLKDRKIALFCIEVLVLFFVLFFSGSLAQGKGSSLTNENLLRKTISEVLEDCLSQAPLDSMLVWIKEEGENPSSWIIEEELLSYLRKSGPVGLGKNTEDEKDGLILTFRIIRMDLEYPKVQRKKFWGRSWVQREAKVALSFNLSDVEGRVLWSRRGEGENSDWIKMDELAVLNNRQYPFLSPEVPESSWGRYFEPAVVTVVVGALVYLFFANR